MDGGVRRLIVDVTDESDERDVAYAGFVRRVHTSDGIFEEDVAGAMYSGAVLSRRPCEKLS